MAATAPPDVPVPSLEDLHAETKARANIAVIADELDLEYRRIVPGIELRRPARRDGADLRDDKIKRTKSGCPVVTAGVQNCRVLEEIGTFRFQGRPEIARAPAP